MKKTLTSLTLSAALVMALPHSANASTPVASGADNDSTAFIKGKKTDARGRTGGGQGDPKIPKPATGGGQGDPKPLGTGGGQGDPR